MPDRVVSIINGPRGSVLLAMSWLCALHGVAYTPLSEGPIEVPLGLQSLGEVVPLEVYGFLWFIAAVLAFLGAFRSRLGRQRDHADAWGFGVAAGLFAAWGTAYIGGWAVAVSDGIPSRSWITGGLYLCLAVIATAAARMTNPRPGPKRRRRRQ